MRTFSWTLRIAFASFLVACASIPSSYARDRSCSRSRDRYDAYSRYMYERARWAEEMRDYTMVNGRAQYRNTPRYW